MPADVVVLVNPTSGRGHGQQRAADAAQHLRRHGLVVEQLVGRDGEEAIEMGRQAVADGVSTVAVCGGDGMVHLGLQLTAQTASRLAVIPAGTGNDFARAIGVPLDDPIAAAEVIRVGSTRRIDLARVADRWFGCVLAAGFDSRVNDRVNRIRWPHGRPRFHLAVAWELARFRPIPFVVTIDGVRHDFEAMLVAVGNGPSYGGGMAIAPSADLTDGVLDVTVLTRMSRPRLVRLFHTVYSGKHVDEPEVLTFRGREITIAAADVAGYADGEAFGALPLTITSVPAAVTVLVPA